MCGTQQLPFGISGIDSIYRLYIIIKVIIQGNSRHKQLRTRTFWIADIRRTYFFPFLPLAANYDTHYVLDCKVHNVSLCNRTEYNIMIYLVNENIVIYIGTASRSWLRARQRR